IQKVYPDKVFEKPFRIPGPPNPPDPPFKPLMLPLQGNALLPQKEATLFRVEKSSNAGFEKTKSKEEDVTERFSAVSSVKLNADQVISSLNTDRVKIAGIVSKLPFPCNVQSYPSALLR